MNSNNRRFSREGRRSPAALCLSLLIVFIVSVASVCQSARTKDDSRGSKRVLTGAEALGDWTTDAPGVRRHITLADLPEPYATKSAMNQPKGIPRPAGAMPRVPDGFKVDVFADGLNNPRLIRVAPNGDLFIAESGPGRIRVLRDSGNTGKPEVNEVFASGLKQPFGIAFYPNGPNPKYIYVGNTDSVVRFAYQNGDIKAGGNPETIVPDIPSGGRLTGGGHWTRDIAFSKDGRKMYVSVGSASNDLENPKVSEDRRADILEYNPDGSGFRLFASGIRNPVGITVNPETGQLWASVNERDALGDNLVPDYITHVQEGGFYGWPWFYMGNHQDPRHPGEHPELASKVLVPDVLLQSHSASLEMTFYTGKQFPSQYVNDAFASEHGSWNRSHRTGYKVIRVPMKNGRATGEYEDFMTGFVADDGNVWGRPVGVAVARDGSLYVSDDGSNTIWRITYTGKR
jgi:glucose/arabinose dehydrogenase